MYRTQTEEVRDGDREPGSGGRDQAGGQVQGHHLSCNGCEGTDERWSLRDGNGGQRVKQPGLSAGRRSGLQEPVGGGQRYHGWPGLQRLEVLERGEGGDRAERT